MSEMLDKIGDAIAGCRSLAEQREEEHYCPAIPAEPLPFGR